MNAFVIVGGRPYLTDGEAAYRCQITVANACPYSGKRCPAMPDASSFTLGEAVTLAALPPERYSEEEIIAQCGGKLSSIPPAFDNMTVTELKAYASAGGITLESGAVKADIVAAIIEAEGWL